MNQNPFISCDWGTSSFRLRWVDPGLVIRQEIQTSDGCRALFQRAADQPARALLFESTLRQHLDALQPEGTPTIPLVISGMASSSIGWRELPYLRDPLQLNGSNLLWEKMAWPGPAWLGPTILISGVTCNGDIIRGEEIEAVGILNALNRTDGTLVLPGTHSKHLVFENSLLKRLSTFMTGELFEVLTTHSVLSASVQPSSSTPNEAFEQGVAAARQTSLSQALFRVRTRAVLDKHAPHENAWYLSGLLIGAELCSTRTSNEPILIGGVDSLRELYARAATALQLSFRSLPPTVVQRASVRGQAILLTRIFPEAYA